MLAETICSAVSAAGLGIAAVTAYRKRFLAATRIAAYSLVPVGLVLTGAVAWVAGIVYKPTVWLGFGLLGAAWLLFMTTRAVERRGLGTRREGAATERAARGGAIEPGAASGLPATRPQSGAKTRRPSASSGDDFSDIEAILKKHGI
ncbi:hypothetical protein [Streptomyces sp. NPDC052042]|uniref:hypothetical protein n=1 Tax=Streptomyces sp. NPDC052042 TaxID=3365683 RepID=UPI0037D96F54